MLTCRDLVQSDASDYLDGQLGWWHRMAVRAHLMLCAHCRRFMKQMKLLREVLALRPEAPQTEEEMKALADKLHQQHQSRFHRK
ncbi:MAG: zf-HC2 domain-containing protein [Lysobacterales bacterium]|jgi:anti-sigma factor ChrR (cupin superfamily)